MKRISFAAWMFLLTKVILTWNCVYDRNQNLNNQLTAQLAQDGIRSSYILGSSNSNIRIHFLNVVGRNNGVIQTIYVHKTSVESQEKFQRRMALLDRLEREIYLGDNSVRSCIVGKDIRILGLAKELETNHFFKLPDLKLDSLEKFLKIVTDLADLLGKLSTVGLCIPKLELTDLGVQTNRDNKLLLYNPYDLYGFDSLLSIDYLGANSDITLRMLPNLNDLKKRNKTLKNVQLTVKEEWNVVVFFRLFKNFLTASVMERLATQTPINLILMKLPSFEEFWGIDEFLRDSRKRLPSFRQLKEKIDATSANLLEVSRQFGQFENTKWLLQPYHPQPSHAYTNLKDYQRVVLPPILTRTVESLNTQIDDVKKHIDDHKNKIDQIMQQMKALELKREDSMQIHNVLIYSASKTTTEEKDRKEAAQPHAEEFAKLQKEIEKLEKEKNELSAKDAEEYKKLSTLNWLYNLIIDIRKTFAPTSS